MPSLDEPIEYFHAGLEHGNWQSEFDRLQQGVGPPDCVTTVQQDRVKAGKYAVRLELTNPGGGDFYRRLELHKFHPIGQVLPTFNKDEVFLSGWVYVPITFKLKVADNQIGWWSTNSIREINADTHQPKLQIRERIAGPDYEQDLVMQSRRTGTCKGNLDYETSDVQIPLGQWNYIVMYFKRNKPNPTGIIKGWLNHRKTLDTPDASWVYGCQDTYRIEWKLYTNIGQYPNWVVWDEMRATDIYPETEDRKNDELLEVS